MITANIITLNEEKHIAECIESVAKVCSEIIVVDSGSVDSTVSIAKSLGANVIYQPYLGDGFQKNIAMDHASNEWILSLDADERLSEEMVEVIKKIDFSQSPFDGYAFRRKNMIGSRWIKECGWYPDFCVRLYHHKRAKFSEVKQHSSVKCESVCMLKADIIHYSFENIGQLFCKPGRDFSGRAAKVMYLNEKKVNAYSPFIHGFSAFLKKYLLQKGFLAGLDGLTVSISAGLSGYLKYARLLELKKDLSVSEKEDFNKIW
ncbi:glycosyltransferase family 2 protein [Vreelandella arcis]|uniref:Glycosyltransferase involved in cell wall bisynthesis n=1 Tax=Vreelandella arcis TaxID=416873 RepID=A0A1H0IR19_9GAMM|nr:glycosyltransferase family 2 protein [Halomonas arcis]SDO33491.1 Glycosyltransferase involved in cell wall bisynthesis [Halomonas arcis]